MPALATIQHIGFDTTTNAPRFEIGLGSNTYFRFDGTTSPMLFGTNQNANRNSANYFSSGWIQASAGGNVEFRIPDTNWNGIQLSTGVFAFRVTTRDINYNNFVRSLPLGQITGVPQFSTDLPIVSAISPQTGSLGGGETINISGSGFNFVTAVKFGSQNATNFQIINDNLISTTSPQSSTAGSVPIFVESPLGSSTSGPQSIWNYSSPSVPDFLNPIPGSILNSETVTFRWQSNGTTVEDWWLELISSENNQQYSSFVIQSSMTSDSGLVGNIPLDGRTLTARLWYKITGTWSFTEATYTTRINASFVQDRQSAVDWIINEIIPIDDSQVTYPNDEDLLLIIYNDKSVLLPASWNLLLRPNTGAPPTIQPIAVMSVATVGKEGFYLVSVGGRITFAMDAGGARKVVFPHALGKAMRALGTKTIDGMIIKHIDQDHVRQFRRLKNKYGIPANRIYFSDAFDVGPSGTPGSTLQRMVQRIIQDHPNEQFNRIPTPAVGSNTTFNYRLHRREITIDVVGDTSVFNMLKALRRQGVSQTLREIRNLRDAAIPMVRITHQNSGLRILDITDLRGQDIQRYHDRMGSNNFRSWVKDVTVLKGFQHHMGALEPSTHAVGQADRRGLNTLLRETYLRNGTLDIIVQSRLLAPGSPTSFRLNKSLVRVLCDIGINVYLALQGQSSTSTTPGSAGTITCMSNGEIRLTRGGTMESHFGNPRMQESAQALGDLYKLSRLFQQYGNQIPTDLRNRLANVSNAFQNHANNWDSLLRIGLANVFTDPLQRTNFRVINVSEFRSAINAAIQIPAVYTQLSAADLIEGLESFRVLEIRRRFNEEVRRIRTNGKVSSMSLRRMVRVLRDLRTPEIIQFISNSSLSIKQQERLIRLSTPRTSIRIRVSNALLVLLLAATELARWMPILQAYWYQQNVKPFLKAILWWQNMRILPLIKGLDDNVINDVITTDPYTIQNLLAADDIDGLALTSLPLTISTSVNEMDVWDVLALTINVEVNHFLDWCHFVRESGAIKKTPNGWAYRIGDIIPTTLDYDVTEQWVQNSRLNDIINELYKRVQKNTSEGIAALRFGPPPPGVPTFQPVGYSRHEVYEGFPSPAFIAKFNQALTNDERRLWTPDFEQHIYTGYSADSVFYVFPNSASIEQVPQGKVVVGGANFATYEQISIQQLTYRRYVIDPQGNTQIVGFEDHYNRFEIMWADPNTLEYMTIE